MSNLRHEGASLGAALIDALGADDLETLADRLRPLLGLTLEQREHSPQGWMASSDAASYLGMTVPALHKLTARREIPSHQERPGCKHWFLKAELDRWRAARSMS